jgi:hypothetical protein
VPKTPAKYTNTWLKLNMLKQAYDPEASNSRNELLLTVGSLRNPESSMWAVEPESL